MFGVAFQILDRAASLGARRLARVDELQDALGRTRARLTVTPEQIAGAKEQVRQGRIVPAKELRDELHARLCARRPVAAARPRPAPSGSRARRPRWPLRVTGAAGRAIGEVVYDHRPAL